MGSRCLLPCIVSDRAYTLCHEITLTTSSSCFGPFNNKQLLKAVMDVKYSI